MADTTQTSADTAPADTALADTAPADAAFADTAPLEETKGFLEEIAKRLHNEEVIVGQDLWQAIVKVEQAAQHLGDHIAKLL